MTTNFVAMQTKFKTFRRRCSYQYKICCKVSLKEVSSLTAVRPGSLILIIYILTIYNQFNFCFILCLLNPASSDTSVRPTGIFFNIRKAYNCLFFSCDNLCVIFIPDNVCRRVTICSITSTCKVITLIHSRDTGTIDCNNWCYCKVIN